MEITFAQRPDRKRKISCRRFFEITGCPFFIRFHKNAFQIAPAEHKNGVRISQIRRFLKIAVRFFFIDPAESACVFHQPQRSHRFSRTCRGRAFVISLCFLFIFLCLLFGTVHFTQGIQRTPISFFCAFFEPGPCLIPVLIRAEAVQIHIAQLIGGHQIACFRRRKNMGETSPAKFRHFRRKPFIHVRQIQAAQIFSCHRALFMPVACLFFVPVTDTAETVIIIFA